MERQAYVIWLQKKGRKRIKDFFPNRCHKFVIHRIFEHVMFCKRCNEPDKDCKNVSNTVSLNSHLCFVTIRQDIGCYARDRKGPLFTNLVKFILRSKLTYFSADSLIVILLLYFRVLTNQIDMPQSTNLSGNAIM